MMRINHSAATFREISQVTERNYFPHTVRAESRVLACRANLVSQDLGDARLVQLNWGAAVHVETEHPGSFAINVPLRGRMSVRSAHGRQEAAAHTAIVCPPDVPVAFPAWGGEVTMLGLRLNGDYLRHNLEEAGLRSPKVPVLLNLREGYGMEWLAIATSLLSQRQDGAGLMDNPLVGRHLAAALASGLTLMLADLQPAGQSPTPARVRRAAEALETDPARAWTVAEIAAVAGCGIRSLQAGFRTEFGVGPMEYLRGIRLDVIHDELQACDPNGTHTVTEIATRWGVTHLGRFSAAYRRRFGEAPRHTLSTARP